jgi:peptidoglycan L-alanyl-D-glutamate endopeptidase CwlK
VGALRHRERLVGTHPKLIAFAEDAAAALDCDLLIVFGCRLEAEQVHLYAEGRTIPGPHAGEKGYPALGATVTNAEHAEQTAHGRGGGIDAMPLVDGKLVWDEKDPLWPEVLKRLEQLAELAKPRGIVWGGSWPKLKDLDHFELAAWRALPFRR